MNRVPFQADVVYAQPAALRQPQPGPIQELGHQTKYAVAPFDAAEDARHLLRPQDDWQPLAAPRPQRVDRPEVNIEHPAVEEDEGVESLVLGGGRHATVRCQVGKELFDFRGAHVTWVAFVVEEDETNGP